MKKSNKNSDVKRRVPVQARSKQLVNSVLEATAQVLEEVGAESLSTNKVAQRAGVSIGSIYQYFPHKEALLEGLAQEHMSYMTQVMMKDILKEAEGLSFPEIMKFTIRAYVDLLCQQPELTKLMLDHILRLRPVAVEDPESLRGWQVISNYLAKHEDELDVKDRETATFMVFHIAQLMGVKIALEPKEKREGLIDEVSRMLSLYVGAE